MNKTYRYTKIFKTNYLMKKEDMLITNWCCALDIWFSLLLSFSYNKQTEAQRRLSEENKHQYYDKYTNYEHIWRIEKKFRKMKAPNF